jgi:hypothetical protein
MGYARVLFTGLCVLLSLQVSTSKFFLVETKGKQNVLVFVKNSIT